MLHGVKLHDHNILSTLTQNIAVHSMVSTVICNVCTVETTEKSSSWEIANFEAVTVGR